MRKKGFISNTSMMNAVYLKKKVTVQVKNLQTKTKMLLKKMMNKICCLKLKGIQIMKSKLNKNKKNLSNFFFF